MSSVITYNSAVISNSITNPDVDKSAAADNSSPYSFLQFITITRVDYTPDEYNNFYIAYLKDWSTVKNANSTTEQTSFVEYYVEFLKEVLQCSFVFFLNFFQLIIKKYGSMTHTKVCPHLQKLI